MKLRQLFFLLILLLPLVVFAQVQWITANQVTIAWDAVTTKDDGTPLGPTDTVIYGIYIRDVKTAVEAKVIEVPGITYTHTFTAEGRYHMGVTAIRGIDNGDGTITVTESSINWSDVDGVYTPNPFALKYFINPSMPENLHVQ